MIRKAATMLILAVSIAGCASLRGAKVESDAASTYAISVHNARSSSVVVSYTTDGDTRQLGSVGAGETHRFVVVSQSPTVTVHARTSGGTELSSRTVSLTQGSTSTVTIQ